MPKARIKLKATYPKQFKTRKVVSKIDAILKDTLRDIRVVINRFR